MDSTERINHTHQKNQHLKTQISGGNLKKKILQIIMLMFLPWENSCYSNASVCFSFFFLIQGISENTITQQKKIFKSHIPRIKIMQRVIGYSLKLGEQQWYPSPKLYDAMSSMHSE